MGSEGSLGLANFGGISDFMNVSVSVGISPKFNLDPPDLFEWWLGEAKFAYPERIPLRWPINEPFLVELSAALDGGTHFRLESS
jgi:hypothetical protein